MKTTGYILNGVYYNDEPNMNFLRDTRTVTDKQYGHDRQRENHQRDLIQPYKDGKPNQEFIEQYPEESKDYGFDKR